MRIVLASKSEVRKIILDKNGINSEVLPSNIDEKEVKISLISKGATPMLISKNLAELKANKISLQRPNELVLGADSVIDFNGELISKPLDRNEALNILQKLNEKKHQLISSVCIIFYIVQKILGNSGHALELFALLTALALFFIDRLSRKAKK